MVMCCEKKTMIGWRNVWSMKYRVPGQQVDQRKLGKRLWKRTARHVNWRGRMPWIIVDGWSRQGMIDDHDRCRWVNVSSGTGSPPGCVCVRACVRETPVLEAGSLTRTNCSLLAMQKGSRELTIGCCSNPCLDDPQLAPWIMVSIPLGVPNQAFHSPRLASGKTTSRQNCSLPLHCSPHCSHCNIDSLVDCSLHAPPSAPAETSYLLTHHLLAIPLLSPTINDNRASKKDKCLICSI